MKQVCMLVQMMQLNLRLCLYAMRCTIWYYLRNLKKREKHPWRAVTFSKVEACNFTQSNNPSLVLFVFQIVQMVPNHVRRLI